MKTPAQYALAIRCPACRALPGKPCRATVRGKPRGTVLRYPHASRLPPVRTPPEPWVYLSDKVRPRPRLRAPAAPGTLADVDDPRGPGIIGSHWVQPSPLVAGRPRSAVTSAAPPPADADEPEPVGEIADPRERAALMADSVPA